MWLRIFRAPPGSESCCVRICLTLLACGLLITVPRRLSAQSTPGPRPPRLARRQPRRRPSRPSSAADARSRARRAAGGACRVRRSRRRICRSRAAAWSPSTCARARCAGPANWPRTWAPSVDGALVVVAGDELLTALDTATGRPVWRVPVAGGFSAPPIAASGWVDRSARPAATSCPSAPATAR